MDLFISWSGETSRQYAELLRGWLPTVLQAVKPFHSDEDIAKGAAWSEEISTRLQKARAALVLITPENLEAPWLHFEAGAVSRMPNARVAPLLLGGVKKHQLKGPLTRFQLTEFERDDFRKLVASLNSLLSDTVEPNAITQIYDLLWPKLQKSAQHLAKSVASEAPRAQNTGLDETQSLPEILDLCRSIAASVEQLPHEARQGRHIHASLEPGKNAVRNARVRAPLQVRTPISWRVCPGVAGKRCLSDFSR